MNKDNKNMKKGNSGTMRNQSTVGDTDGNNSEVIMDDTGITTYLDLDKKCDDDAKNTQPDTNKK